MSAPAEAAASLAERRAGFSPPEGRLADNIVYFARALRKAGLRVGPAATRDAIEAVLAGGIGSRDDFYWTLHAVLVNRREDHAVFDEAFRLFWKSRELVEKMLAMFSPKAPPRRAEERRPRAGESRVSEALFEGHARRQREVEVPQVEVDARFTVSGNEILRAKDFAQMTAAEMAAARRALTDLRLPDDRVATRRYRPGRRARFDPRAMMRRSLKAGGDLILPAFRQRRQVAPPLVVIADISGSMSQYSRLFLHFAHALMERRRRVHVFTFGTRLTNVTRQLRARDPDLALAGAARAVADWSGGTRIAEAVGRFNRLWSRRVLSQGAVVLLITDGLERDDVERLGPEMERLRKSCRRLIWLNPLLRFDGFEARARGVRAMLPHVDEFRAVHSLDALADLCAALSGDARAGACDPRRFLRLQSLEAAA